MKKLIQVFCFVLVASVVSAQQAPLTVPVTKPVGVAKRIGGVDLSRFPVHAVIRVNVVDADGNATGDYYNVNVPRQAGDDPAHPTASISGFLTVIMSTQAGETGPVAQRFDFRVLTWLKAQGYLPDTQPVVP